MRRWADYEPQTVRIMLRHIGPNGEYVRFAIGAFGGLDVALFPLDDWERISMGGRKWGGWVVLLRDWLYGAYLSGQHKFEDLKRRLADALIGKSRSDKRQIPLAEFKKTLPEDRKAVLAWLMRVAKTTPDVECDEPGAFDEEMAGDGESLAGGATNHEALGAGGGADADVPF